MKTDKKKSFIIYDDSLEVLNDLSNEEIGIIFREISNYRQGKDVTLSGTLLVIFNIFKNQILRDETKYIAKCLKNKENIQKRWEDNKQIQPNTTEYNGTKRNTNHTDTDNDNDTESDTDNKKNFEDFWVKFHKITSKSKTDKDPTLRYWKKLSINEKGKATENIQKYFDNLNSPKYCKKARTYLSDKNFNDEFDSDNTKRTLENPFPEMGKRVTYD
jgi:hypothetical protein